MKLHFSHAFFRRCGNALRKLRAGLRLRGENISPEVPNDLYQAHRSIYLFATQFISESRSPHFVSVGVKRRESRLRFARVLDVGCGAGYGTALLRRAGAETAVGIDLDPRNVAYARRRFGGKGIEFRVGNAEALPQELGFVDLVVVSNVLEHLSSPGRALARVGALLSPGGRLVVAVPPIVDEQGRAEHDAIPYHRSNLFIWEWRDLLLQNFKYVQAVRHLPPEGARLDFADPFPSQVAAEAFRFEECSAEELIRMESLTALFVCHHR